MIGLLCFVLAVLASPFKSKIRLEAENAVLRHQLIVLRRKLRGRVQLANSDRWFFVQLYRWFPSILKVLTIIRPETLVRWHQAGLRSYWRWKSRSLGGRPQIDAREMIALVSASSSARTIHTHYRDYRDIRDDGRIILYRRADIHSPNWTSLREYQNMGIV